jgi:hypothetical protein
MGYDVGCRFAERAARDRPRMLEPLDVIKFVCKDLWIAIFKKQIDKLQTNHRGVFVVQDFGFHWLAGISAATEQETREMALLFLVFPCGLIRGALANLGLTAVVNADVPDIRALPGCTWRCCGLLEVLEKLTGVCCVADYGQVYLTLRLSRGDQIEERR